MSGVMQSGSRDVTETTRIG